MIRRNPYSVGVGLQLYLRSTSGQFSSWSKAKSFEIRKGKETVFFDEFPRVNLSSKIKGQIVEEALKALGREEEREVSTRREDFDFFSESLGIAVGEKFWGTFDEPIKIESDDKESFRNVINENLRESIMAAFLDSFEGEDLYLLRVTYETDSRRDGQLVKTDTGFGEFRRQITDVSQMEALIDMVITGFGNVLKKYLQLSSTKTIRLTGFTLENVIETEE